MNLSADTKAGRLQKRVRACAGAVLDVLYPRNCVCCGAPACESGEGFFRYLCPACAQACAPYEGTRCETCGMPMPGLILSPHACPECLERDGAFSRGQTLGVMRGPLRALIHALKYAGQYRVLDDVMSLCERSGDYLPRLEGAVLVPIPLFYLRQDARGYNQSERIARALALRAVHCEVRPLLRRTRDTLSQTHLDKPQRRKNMQGAFAPAKRGAPIEKQRLHVLVDDVFTTGATLNAAAVALRRLGVETVHVATIAHG